MPRFLFLIALLAIAAPGCKSTTGDTPAPNQAHEPKADQPIAQDSKDSNMDDPPTVKVQVSETEAANLAIAHNALGLDLWQRAAPDGNAVISPASLGMALAMTYLGARGDTAKQMRKVLHIDSNDETYQRAHAGLLQAWLEPKAPAYEGEPAPPELRVANRLFVEKTLDVVANFLQATQEGFRAPADLVDFAGEPKKTREWINGWVAEQTKDRIRDLIPPPAITSDTRMVLTNAIYFKGQWANKFGKAATQDKPFFVNGKSKTAVPTMVQVEHLAYRDVGDAKLVDLPYTGNQFAMTIVLPNKRDGLALVETAMSNGGLKSWFEPEAKYERVRIELPRFKVAPKKSLAVGDALKALGMPLAFDRDQADFTGIHVFKKPADRLLISEVFHKGFVEVDENGTEAAAATAVVMARVGSAAPTDEPRPFVVDHPFLFLIRDTQTGMVMFLGRVVDPR